MNARERNATGTVTLFDLGSRHGTKLNKQDVPARTHVRWHVGSMARFGESTRLVVLNAEGGPDQEEPVDTEEDRQRAARRVAAMTAARRRRQEELDAAAAAASSHDVERDGITWSVVVLWTA